MSIPCTRKFVGFALVLAALLGAASEAGAQWAGDNGLIRFSFVEGDSIVSTVQREAENGVTLVDVYAWLTDVEPVARDGEAFLATGGFEFELVIGGAEAFVLEKNIPIKNLDMGKTKNECVVGLDPGMSIKWGRVMLVHWKVMFQGSPQDVVFGLKAGPGQSCTTVDGCAECAPPAIYIGVEASEQLTTFFGAGYVPAYLNPKGATDFTPVTGSCGFEEVGLFERR